MSMIYFYGAAINSENLLCFTVSEPKIKSAVLRDTDEAEIIASSSGLIAQMKDGTKLSLERYIDQITYREPFRYAGGKHETEFKDTVDFVRAKNTHMQKKLSGLFKSARDEMLQEVCKEWNELVKRQGGAA